MNFRKWLSLIVFFLVFSAVHLSIFVQNISLTYRLTEGKIKLSELNSRNRLLGGSVAREENLVFIEKTAKEKLGMVYPENIKYIIGSKEAVNGQS